MKGFGTQILMAAALAASVLATGCSTAPKASDQASFRREASSALWFFQDNVPGLRAQLASSAGYIVFPGIGQWGIIFGGGQFGRGTVSKADGKQIGWGAINTGSIGLQAGVRGFKMLMVFQNQATMDKYMANQLSGQVSGVVVAGGAGTSGTAPFVDGVAVYQGASAGLMAGVNIGLDLVRYKPLGDDD